MASGITITGALATPLVAGVYTNTAAATCINYDWTMVFTSSLVFTVTNSAPSFTSTPVMTGTQASAYAYPITTQDLNGDPVTITADPLPGWLSLTDYGNGTALLSGTPANLDVGDHLVELQVTDTGHLTHTQSFSITVANLNDAPEFTSTPVITATLDSPYTYTLTTTDPDIIYGDVLTITATTQPAWLVLVDHGDGTATLTGTPILTDFGEHLVVLKVTDHLGLQQTQSFTITVEGVIFKFYLPLILKNGI